MLEPLSSEQERRVLNNRSTRKMVLDILRLAETKDPVDAARDSELAARILAGRCDRPFRSGRNDRERDGRSL